MNERPPKPTNWAQTIRAVAFDMDGLLVNTEDLYTQVGDTILQRRGRLFSRDLKNAMTGLPGPLAFQLMIEREGLTDSVDELEAESADIFARLLPKQLSLLPGVNELLSELEQLGHPKCVATSSTREFANTVLSQVGILERFQFVITAQDVPHGKPHPDIYIAAATRMKVQAEQMLVLEDSHHGCRAGVSSGACTVAVPGPHSEDHDFGGVHFRANTLFDPGIKQLLAMVTN